MRDFLRACWPLIAAGILLIGFLLWLTYGVPTCTTFADGGKICSIYEFPLNVRHWRE